MRKSVDTGHWKKNHEKSTKKETNEGNVHSSKRKIRDRVMQGREREREKQGVKEGKEGRNEKSTSRLDKQTQKKVLCVCARKRRLGQGA